ncbi:MAG TPA: hypothetical protein VNL18_10260 [Gemmatimonadales bacterium]|nr:hypothetical protein [Gemmatimonadales bacterium]
MTTRLDRSARRAVLTATAVSLAMITYQIAAKATRDALFLSSFDVATLPRMVMTAATASIVLAVAAARWISAAGPHRAVPALFGLSAALLLVEWAMVEPYRRAAAVLVYLHNAALGAILISGFWSLINERFDPRTAKREVNRIVTGGTIGGLLGGLVAERAGAWGSAEGMLPFLAGVHVVCAILLRGVVGSAVRPPRAVRTEPGVRTRGATGFAVIAQTPYLQAIIALVLLTTVGEGILDYAFKARAAGAGDDETLLRLFAVFYSGVAVFSIAVQMIVARPAFGTLGIARTAALLPGTVVAGAVGALAAPGLVSALTARGLEAVVRNSLYRPAYELLFAPIRPQEKRATKTMIDVGAVRIGDLLGGAFIQLVLLAARAVAVPILLAVGAALAAAGVLLSLRLHRAYVQTLEQSLLQRADQLDLSHVQDAAVRSTLLWSIGIPVLTEASGFPRPPTKVSGEAEAPMPAAAAPALEGRIFEDAELRRLLDLRSRVPDRVRRALEQAPLTPATGADAIRLLAWDVMAQHAVTALRNVASRMTGQLVDRLLDPDEEFAIRRRIPLVLAASPTARAVEGLLLALEDQRFEVRYRAGRALNHLLATNPNLRVDRDRVIAAVLREVAVDRGVWESRRLLDRHEDEEWSPVLDELVRDRANRSLEHVFTMLALLLPREPLKVAFRGLHTSDAVLRGTALEYLETALPPAVRRQLWPFLEDDRPASPDKRPSNEIVADLLRSRLSIQVNLEELKRRSG